MSVGAESADLGAALGIRGSCKFSPDRKARLRFAPTDKLEAGSYWRTASTDTTTCTCLPAICSGP